MLRHGDILVTGIGLSLFSQEIAAFAGQPGKGSWVRILGWVLALDAIAYLPLARLRFDERPTRFAGIQITEIVTNLSLNVFFLGFASLLMKVVAVNFWQAFTTHLLE